MPEPPLDEHWLVEALEVYSSIVPPSVGEEVVGQTRVLDRITLAGDEPFGPRG